MNMTPMDFLDIIQPDDWHLHLRDGEFLKTVVPHTGASAFEL